MKILVATKETQGTRKNDFCFVPEGEIVTFGHVCTNGVIDDDCGCRRSMSGTVCLKGTTTLKVVETADDGPPILLLALCEHYYRGGWPDSKSGEEVESMVKNDARELAEIAAHFDIDEILEKRGRTFQSRAGGMK